MEPSNAEDFERRPRDHALLTPGFYGARILTQMMITSVEKGWASGAAVRGATVGGKTGTAETGRGTSHAWFIGFAGPDPAHLRYAVAAMVEEGGEGSRVAVPIAQRVLQVALQQP